MRFRSWPAADRCARQLACAVDIIGMVVDRRCAHAAEEVVELFAR